MELAKRSDGALEERINLVAPPQIEDASHGGNGKLELSEPQDSIELSPQNSYPLEHRDGILASITARNVLQCHPHEKTLDILRDWARALKSGGRLRVSVPNLETIALHVARHNPHDLPLENMIVGTETQPHRACFAEDGLRLLLLQAGFRRIRRWAPMGAGETDLGLEGYVHEARTIRGLIAAISRPRLGFNDSTDCIMQVLGPLGIPLARGDGVYWGIVLTACFEQAIEAKARYVMTIDYDSIFTAEHVQELYRLMEENPQADAISSVQMRRNMDSSLTVMKDENNKHRATVPVAEFQDDLTPITSSHFGLTMLRIESLQRLPRPWFLHQPDKDGRWGPDCVHEDVKFWHKWKDAANTLFQANYVSIGHLELIVKWRDRDYDPIYQYLDNWRRFGIPFEVAR